MQEKTKLTLLTIAGMDESCPKEELDALRAYLDGEVQRKPIPELYTKLYTISDVCEYLRVTRGTVWKWTKEGVLNPVHLTGSQKSIRYKQADVFALLEEGKA